MKTKTLKGLTEKLKARVQPHKPQISMTILVDVINITCALSYLTSTNITTDAWDKITNIINYMTLPAIMTYTCLVCVISKQREMHQYFKMACKIAAITMLVSFSMAIKDYNKNEASVVLNTFLASASFTTSFLMYGLFVLTKPIKNNKNKRKK